MFLSTATLDLVASSGRVRQKSVRRLRARRSPPGLLPIVVDGRLLFRLASSAALAGLDVEVAARHWRAPIGDQVPRALEIGRPFLRHDRAGVCQTVLNWPSAWISPI